MSDNLVALFHHGWPHLTTLGALVDIGRAVPDGQVIDRMIHHFREVDRLRQAGIGGPAMIRQLIVIGVLVGRAVFDVLGVPKSRSRAIERPDFGAPTRPAKPPGTAKKSPV